MTNTDSFYRVFNSQKDRIFDFALRMLHDTETASDISQEVFLRFFKAQNSGQNFHNPVAWIFKTARNLCLNHIRKFSREALVADLCEPESATINTNFERAKTLRDAVLALELPMRDALILKVYEGFSYNQIAEILETTRPAVRSMLYKARLKLKENLNSKHPKR